MSRLSVYWPEEADFKSIAADEPRTVKFPHRSWDLDQESSEMDVVTRARVLFANRSCHSCRYPVVEPIELCDSTYNRSGQAIPGTATLIGFRCCGCGNEWPIIGPSLVD